MIHDKGAAATGFTEIRLPLIRYNTSVTVTLQLQLQFHPYVAPGNPSVAVAHPGTYNEKTLLRRFSLPTPLSPLTLS